MIDKLKEEEAVKSALDTLSGNEFLRKVAATLYEDGYNDAMDDLEITRKAIIATKDKGKKE